MADESRIGSCLSWMVRSSSWFRSLVRRRSPAECQAARTNAVYLVPTKGAMSVIGLTWLVNAASGTTGEGGEIVYVWVFRGDHPGKPKHMSEPWALGHPERSFRASLARPA